MLHCTSHRVSTPETWNLLAASWGTFPFHPYTWEVIRIIPVESLIFLCRCLCMCVCVIFNWKRICSTARIAGLGVRNRVDKIRRPTATAKNLGTRVERGRLWTVVGSVKVVCSVHHLLSMLDYHILFDWFGRNIRYVFSCLHVLYHIKGCVCFFT